MNDTGDLYVVEFGVRHTKACVFASSPDEAAEAIRYIATDADLDDEGFVEIHEILFAHPIMREAMSRAYHHLN